jgi:hypothetical protein
MIATRLQFFLVSAVFALVFVACVASNACAQTPSAAPALGLIANTINGNVGDAAAIEGSTVYSGDYLATREGGSMLVRFGSLSLELQPSSGAHIYRAPYGVIVELNHGTAIYATPGSQQNLVIVASDVRVTPILSLADMGRVSLEDPCHVSVYSQRGQADVQTGPESRVVEEGKAYKVTAMNEVSYRDFVSPDVSDYHSYHTHKACAAPTQMVHSNRAAIAAGTSHFVLVSSVVVGVTTGILIYKALESPARP